MKNISVQDEAYLRSAFEIAVSSGKHGYDTFGALFVYDGTILTTAENRQDDTNNIFGHAEFNLIHQLAYHYPEDIIRRGTMYCNCAPCIRCILTCAAFGVSRIVYGLSTEYLTRLNPGRKPTPEYGPLLQKLGFQIEVIGPCLEQEAAKTMEWWRGSYHPLKELLTGHIIGNSSNRT